LAGKKKEGIHHRDLDRSRLSVIGGRKWHYQNLERGVGGGTLYQRVLLHAGKFGREGGNPSSSDRSGPLTELKKKGLDGMNRFGKGEMQRIVKLDAITAHRKKQLMRRESAV